MRMLGIILFTLIAPLVLAKSVHIRANIVPQCGVKTEASASSAPIGPKLNQDVRLNCAQKTAWAKISTQDERQWQRISIDY